MAQLACYFGIRIRQNLSFDPLNETMGMGIFYGASTSTSFHQFAFLLAVL